MILFVSAEKTVASTVFSLVGAFIFMPDAILNVKRIIEVERLTMPTNVIKNFPSRTASIN